MWYHGSQKSSRKTRTNEKQEKSTYTWNIMTHILCLFTGVFIGIFVTKTLRMQFNDIPIPYANLSSGSMRNDFQTNTTLTSLTSPPKQRLFTDAFLREIYNKHIVHKIRDTAYLTKYQWLSNATWLAKEFDPRYFIGHNKAHFKFDLSRVIQTASFRDYVYKYNLLDPANCDHTLTFDVGVDPEVQYFNGFFSDTHNISKCKHFTALYYKGSKKSKADLYTLDLDFKQWDIILLPQFLEHFFDPELIMKNVYRHLREGGFLYVSVPTINVPHMTPIHFQHFQPMGLAALAKKTGFDILEIDWWGNKHYIDAIFLSHWPNYLDRKWYLPYEPLINQWKCVAQTWGLFQKPLSD